MRGRANLAFELERFEWVPLEGEAVLLRLAGRWRSGRLRRVPAIRLAVASHADELMLEELPDPGALPAFADAEPPPWRTGFALPSWTAGARFSLRTGEGRTFALPAPAAAALAPSRGDAALEALLAEAERDRARSEEALEVASRRLAQEIERRQAAERELEERRGNGTAAAAPHSPFGNGSAPGDLGWLAAEAMRRARQLRALEERVVELKDALEGD